MKLLLLLLLPLSVLAGEITISILPSTERQDGEKMTVDELDRHEVFINDEPAEINPVAPEGGQFIVERPAGTYVVRVKTVANDGTESTLSDSLEKVISASPPKPPLVTVE